MRRRMARPVPRMIRCGGIDVFYFIISTGERNRRLVETLIDAGQQRGRRERLAQATHRAELGGHAQEIRHALGVGEGVAGHRDDRNIGPALVEHPDRFDAAHVRHEDVDQHHVEIGRFECPHSRFTTVGNGDLEAPTLQTNLDGDANHRVVIDHENARHDESLYLRAAVSDSAVAQHRLRPNRDKPSVWQSAYKILLCGQKPVLRAMTKTRQKLSFGRSGSGSPPCLPIAKRAAPGYRRSASSFSSSRRWVGGSTSRS